FAVARKFPGTQGSRGTDWWLYGNQHPIDSSISPLIRQRTQLASAGTAPFANSATSRFESGLNVFVDMEGPNSAGMRAVRVKGPGMPPNGVDYPPPDPSLVLAQHWLNVLRKDGNPDPAAATYSGKDGNSYYLQRSLGVSGSDAVAVRPNPNAG